MHAYNDFPAALVEHLDNKSSVSRRGLLLTIYYSPPSMREQHLCKLSEALHFDPAKIQKAFAALKAELDQHFNRPAIKKIRET